MTLKEEVTPAHCVKFILDMVRCVKIQDTPGLQTNVLTEVIKAVRDVGPCSEAFAHNLQEYERRSLLRYAGAVTSPCRTPSRNADSE